MYVLVQGANCALMSCCRVTATFTGCQWSDCHFKWGQECVFVWKTSAACFSPSPKCVAAELCPEHIRTWDLKWTIDSRFSIMDLKSTLLVVGGSVCSFKLLNTILRFLPTPEQALNKSWRWRNICTSLAHSSLSGAWAVLWCVQTVISVGAINILYFMCFLSLTMQLLPSTSVVGGPDLPSLLALSQSCSCVFRWQNTQISTHSHFRRQ